MTDPTFYEQMIEKVQSQLLQLGGLASANIDGNQVVAKDLKEELNYWEKKVREEQNTRPQISRIALDR